MKLLKALSMAVIPDLEEHAETLKAGAKMMLRGGVVLSADDWVELEPAERDAFVAAGDELRAEQALTVAAAVLSPEIQSQLAIAAGVGAEFDRGRALTELQSLMDKIAGKGVVA